MMKIRAVGARVCPQSTGKAQDITIKSSGGLSDDQIQQMVRDAEQYASEDKKRKEAIEAKNEVETTIYSAEKSLDEYKVGGRDEMRLDCPHQDVFFGFFASLPCHPFLSEFTDLLCVPQPISFASWVLIQGREDRGAPWWAWCVMVVYPSFFRRPGARGGQDQC
jgi:Hsp70 protein